MKFLPRYFATVTVALAFGYAASGSYAQPAEPLPTNTSVGATDASAEKPQPKKSPNGIDVSEIKAYDNRTLTLMLESMSDTLRAQQFVNPEALAKAIGTLQGSSRDAFLASLALSTLPIPGSQQEASTTTITNTAVDGKATVAETAVDKTTTTVVAVNPTAPAAPTDTATAPATDGKPSLNAVDLLSEQVNLTYQIFNLRLMLERSLTDRLMDAKPRLQTVLGFTITVHPPQVAEGAEAVVELNLRQANDGARPSIISIMPDEKSYNASAMSTSSTAFSGAAVVKVVQVGYTQKSTHETFFLYRDNDTVSFQPTPRAGDKDATVGWAFRPVLGRKSVSSEPRPFFVVVSIPVPDAQDPDPTHHSAVNLKPTVNSYWRKYDRKAMTSHGLSDVTRTTGFFQSLLRPRIFDEVYTQSQPLPTISVPLTSTYQTALAPQVGSIDWIPVGPKQILVTVNGDNFFTGTRVAIGDKLYAGGTDGLVIKSSQTIELVTTREVLGGNDGAVLGRYGVSAPLVVEPGSTHPGILISKMRLLPSAGGSRQLDIWLKAKGADLGTDLKLADLPQKPMLVLLNGTAVPGPYLRRQEAPDPKDFNPTYSVVLQAQVPDSIVSLDRAIKVTWPFRDPKWTATIKERDPSGMFAVTRISSTQAMITALDGSMFAPPPKGPAPTWTVRVDENNPTLDAPIPAGAPKKPRFEKLTDGSTMLVADAFPPKIVLLRSDGPAFVLDVPDAPPAKPAKEETKTISLNQGDSLWLKIPVESAGTITDVIADGKSLDYYPKNPTNPEEKAAKEVRVQFTRALTEKDGAIELRLNRKDSAPQFVTVAIQTTPKAPAKP